MNNDLNRALKPVKTGTAFIVRNATKPICRCSAYVLSWPIKGLNHLLGKAFQDSDYYKGTTLTKASVNLTNYINSIPYKLSEGIKRL